MRSFFCLGLIVALSWTVARPCSAADVAPPRQTKVFASGTDGYHTYRIPALLATAKGTLLAICEGRKNDRNDHGDLDLVLKRSTDGGATWGPLELIYEEGGTKKITIGNPCPVVDRQGTIWLPFTRDNRDVLVTSSSDDGRTWAKPRDITGHVKQSDWNWYATGPGNGILLRHGEHAGRLVIPCDHRVNGNDDWKRSGRSHVIYSDDSGETWKLGGATGEAMNECAVAELPGGKLLINMRSYRGKSQRSQSTSADGGLTWSEPVDIPALVEPVCQGSLIRLSWPSTSNGKSEKSRLLFSNPADPKTRHRLTLRLSYDEGQTWPVSKLLHEGSAAYSSLAVLPDQSIGVLYERDDYANIIFARCTLEWLTEGKDELGK